jgi:hypothetical protein
MIFYQELKVYPSLAFFIIYDLVSIQYLIKDI